MAKKATIPRDQLPFLKSDMALDPIAVRKLRAMQHKFTTQFDREIGDAEEEAIQRYTQKIAALNEKKALMTKEINADIKKYQALVKELKGTPKPPPKTPKKWVATKATVKDAITKKKETVKGVPKGGVKGTAAKKRSSGKK